MSHLKLFLLGAPRVELNGRPVDLNRRKVIAILTYLAVTRRRHRRDTLATLFWPEADQSTARASLRRELHTLTSTLGNEWLEADRESLALAPGAAVWVDVEQFAQYMTACSHHAHPADGVCDMCLEPLTAAVALYQGDFLAGFTLSDCPEFDDWQFFQAEGLRRDLAAALVKLVHLHCQHSEYDAAITCARRWLALDPLHEPVHRELMQLYALAGQPAAAFRQYQECQRLLDEELGVEPEAATTVLLEAIRTRRFLPVEQGRGRETETGQALQGPATRERTPAIFSKAPVSPSPLAFNAPRHTLPLQTTPFVGRERDLMIILDRLQDAACRLLTLVGPGGIGKTRLALQVAQLIVERQSVAGAFTDGVYFVPLTTVSTPNGLVAAIAEVLAISSPNPVALRQQLLACLRTQQVLLVLDNFEELLTSEVQPESTALITDLLTDAPALKLLITTRVALNVREEWFHQVGGLTFPGENTAENQTTPTATASNLAGYDAVRFFEQCARRVQTDFSLTDKQVQVVRFCRLVDGMPLAIELATAWLKVLTVEQIVDELAHSLDILTARYQNVPARHRSMRLVLEQSWALLNEDEQRVLKRLSILRGGFRQGAAAQVAGASLPLLATLAEKALIRMDAGGRYQMHELLRQFADERLREDEEMASATQAQHSRYYLDFLSTRRPGIESRDEARVLAEIAEEGENVRLAWQWAVAAQDLAALEATSTILWRNLWVHGRAQEGEALFAYAVNHLQRPLAPTEQTRYDRVLLHLQQSRGAFYYFLGDYPTASTLLETTLLLSHQLGSPHDMASTLALLGALNGWQGNFALAQTQLEQALSFARANGNHNRIADVLHELARLRMYSGEYLAAQRLVSESLTISHQLERADWIGYALATLGWISFCLGNYVAARQQYAESLASFRKINHQLGVSLAIGGLSWVAWATREPTLAEARALAEESLAICRRLDHRLNIAHRLGALARIANDAHDYDNAQKYAEEGIAVATQVGTPSFLSLNLSCLGETAYRVGNLTNSRQYLLRALQVATEAQLWPRVTAALFQYAILLQKEGDQAPPHHDPMFVQKQTQALTILTLVAHHPACWHIFQVQATQHQAQLAAALPADVVAVAQAQAATQSLAAAAAAILLY